MKQLLAPPLRLFAGFSVTVGSRIQMLPIICGAFLVLRAPIIEAQVRYEESGRQESLKKAMASVRQLDPETKSNIENYVHNMAITACKGSAVSLQANCLMEAGERNCKQMKSSMTPGACDAATDIAIVNRLSERFFLPASERYRVARSASNVKEAIKYEIQKRRAALATRFRLSDFYSASKIETGLDNFCLKNAKLTDLPWQQCAAAVIWIIGTAS